MANGGHVIINRRDFVKIGLAVGGVAVGYKLFQKDVDKFLYNLINDEPQPPAPTPVVNATVKPTPAPSYLMHDGIKIIGDNQFQKDVVMTLEFGKKYSLPDYEFIKKNTKEIERYIYSSGTMSAADGHTSVDKNWFHGLIEQNDIKTGIYAFSHESGHNYADFNPDIKKQPYYDAEKFANIFYIRARENLSYVNQSEIDKFYQEFNFSQFKS